MGECFFAKLLIPQLSPTGKALFKQKNPVWRQDSGDFEE
jgi:hypothetical protein